MMNDDDRILQDIIAFMDECDLLWPEDIVKRETRIEEDLNITGYDAYEFLEAFVKQFKIKDYSEFNFDDYFEPEGKMVFFDFQRTKNKKELTIGDLERAIETGVLK